MNTQIIGADLGRGYVKAYSAFEGKEYKCCFKATYSEGRKNVDVSKWDNPISVKYDHCDFFMGELAVKEGLSTVDNSQDSKTSDTAEILLMGILSQIAVKDKVKLMFGVPNRNFNKKTLTETIEKYKGKIFEVRNNVTKIDRRITIEDVGIFRESDAALMHILRGGANKKPVGIATVGYRTSELTYFEPGMKFIDKKSTSEELGNLDALMIAKKALELKSVKLSEAELDLSTTYDNEKRIGYRLLQNNLIEVMDKTWNNLSEMDIYIAGGTSLKLNFDSKYKKVDDPQMITAKGLYTVANAVFNKN